MNINNYWEFISESKLNMILESNIQYSNDFIELLKDIRSPIARKLLDLQNKDIDINTNYIDIDFKKDDVITFIPESKLKNIKYRVINTDYDFRSLAEDFRYSGYPGFGPTDRSARRNDIGRIENISIDTVKNYLTGSELQYFIDMNRQYGPLVHFMWDHTNAYGDIIKYSAVMSMAGLQSDSFYSDVPKTEIKVGRFTRNILLKSGITTVSDKEVEDFVNKFKSIMQLSNNVLDRFNIVFGEDLRKYYSENYHDKSTGSLSSSCMRYASTQSFLDIYVNNPEVCSLLIFKSRTGEDKICGRALLWEDNKGRKIMDRIYTNNTPDEEIFKEWAIKNKYLYKEQQTYENDRLLKDGSRISSDENVVIIQLNPEYSYYEYPYLDTFKYYDPIKKTLTNRPTSFDHGYLLNKTGGGYNNF